MHTNLWLSLYPLYMYSILHFYLYVLNINKLTLTIIKIKCWYLSLSLKKKKKKNQVWVIQSRALWLNETIQLSYQGELECNFSSPTYYNLQGEKKLLIQVYQNLPNWGI